jgi:hypothetical protein
MRKRANNLVSLMVGSFAKENVVYQDQGIRAKPCTHLSLVLNVQIGIVQHSEDSLAEATHDYYLLKDPANHYHNLFLTILVLSFVGVLGYVGSTRYDSPAVVQPGFFRLHFYFNDPTITRKSGDSALAGH